MGYRPNRVRKDGPLLTVGMLWSKNFALEGAWDRYLVRRYVRAARTEAIFEELTRVDDLLPFCVACLSQNVHLEDASVVEPGEQPWFYCGNCQVFFMIQVQDRGVQRLLGPPLPKPPAPPKPPKPPIPPGLPPLPQHGDIELPPIEDDDYPGDGPE